MKHGRIRESVQEWARIRAVQGLIAVQRLPLYRVVSRLLRTPVRIKVADDREVQQVRAWLNPGLRHRPVVTDPAVTNYVARRGSAVVGFVQLVRRSPQHGTFAGYWLHSLVVRPRYRRWGIGTQLGRTVVDQARQEGAKELLLQVGSENQAAIKLYRKLGFKMAFNPTVDAQRREEQGSSAHRTVEMRKSLAGTQPESKQQEV
jgi:ribosomal protein S18 acetylase RimI-like enzyme